MKPSTLENTHRVKVSAIAGGKDFLFDPSAVCAAMRRAQTAWATIPTVQRLEVIRRFRQLLAEQSEIVACAARGDEGRALSEILVAEVLPLAEACRFLERQAVAVLQTRRVGRRGRPLWLGGINSEVLREPFGLVLVIAPSNYPLLLPGVQVIQALVAGNAVLLKPGANGGGAAHELARLMNAAGLPSGLLEVLSELPDDAEAAIRAGVDKVFFTGSARTGKQILATLAASATPATMELSGNDAVVIRADADLDLAVRAITFGLRLNAGQTCIAPRRVLVARSVATEFEGRLAQALSSCPPISFSSVQQKHLLPSLAQALTPSAHLLCGKIQPPDELIGPVVIVGVKPEQPLWREDIFAPVMMVVTVANDDESVTLANDSAFALGATIFSRDESGARALASRLNVGVVVINDMIVPTADARLPFGGRKLSGFGVTRGPEGLLEMTTTKVVTLRAGRYRPHLDQPHPSDAALFRNYLALAHGKGLGQRFKALRALGRTLIKRR